MKGTLELKLTLPEAQALIRAAQIADEDEAFEEFHKAPLDWGATRLEGLIRAEIERRIKESGALADKGGE